jgi:hypothetical protein
MSDASSCAVGFTGEVVDAPSGQRRFGRLATDRISELWGLLWVVCIKMVANAEQSCCRRIFEFCP